MFTICARIDSKKSDGNFGSDAVGIIVTAENLELNSPEEIAAKADELFRLAKEAVERQANGGDVAKAPEPQPVPSNGNGQGNGHAAPATGPSNGNGQGNGRRSYGRPTQEPTPKQRQFLRKIAKERNLGPESVAEICRRITGQDPRNLDKAGMSRLIEGLLAESQAA